jgi:dTDP-4-amino-4,6-dideoxygalactose transaminase
MQVPFNKPGITARELGYIQQAAGRLKLSGNGHFTRLCHEWLESRLGVHKALLTHSGTAALEMAAILSGVGPGDEVIMPSFTFASTANAFVLRGATPVFVDVQQDTLNLDPDAVSEAITPSTKAIVPVHYAGVACDMVRLSAIAEQSNLALIEDAAQALCSSDHGRALGTIGGASALSFHETKNIIAGEGGALLITDPKWAARAEIVWEKGTNRAAFSRGEVDKYTWVDIGSSFLPGEITAAFLWGQLERADAITADRLRCWHVYHAAFAPLEQAGLLRRPVVPAETVHNGHIYFLIYPDAASCDEALAGLRARGVDAVRHYVPLHSAPAGRKFGRTHGSLDVTTDLSARLVRLPLWVGLDDAQIDRVVEAVWQVTQVK